MAAGPSRYVKVLLRCHYDCYTVHHEYPRICTVRLRLVTTDADQARMQPRMTTVELRYTRYSRFPCSSVGTSIYVVFTQDIVQFVCLLYTLSQFVQLEKCVGSLMSLPFPLCSHYPLIDRWSLLGTWFVSSSELGTGLRLAGGCEHCFRFPFPAHLDATGFFFVGILNAEAILIT